MTTRAKTALAYAAKGPTRVFGQKFDYCEFYGRLTQVLRDRSFREIKATPGSASSAVDGSGTAASLMML